MARALVTGGAGFIGSHLVERLLDRGDDVTVLDHFRGERPENLNGVRGHRGLDVQNGDILDRDLVMRLVSRADVIFHLAAVKGVRNIVDEPLMAMKVNVHGTENVLEAAREHSKRTVLASTSEIYGQSAEIPFKEDGPRVLGPTSVHRWSYSTAKALGEHMAFAHAERGLAVTVVRYFNVYGPRLHPRGDASVVARFIGLALAGNPLTVHGDGQQSRCFTFVGDAVKATILAASKDTAIGRVFNVGTQDEVAVLRLAQMIVELSGSRSSIEVTPYVSAYPTGFEDTHRRMPDVSRAREVLGFEAAVPLQEGLQETIEWFRANYKS